MRPGDVIIASLAGARETKVRPAVVVASREYLDSHPDVIVGILTSKFPASMTSTDHLVADWRGAGLRMPSCFRTYVVTLDRSNVAVIGRLSTADWEAVRRCVRSAFDASFDPV